jgi:hypothetical protein
LAIQRLERDVESIRDAAIKLQAHESLDLEVRMIFAEPHAQLGDPRGLDLLRLSFPPTRKGVMAKKMVFVSDLSGDPIPDGRSAKIRITFEDGRKPSFEIDATEEEANELGRKGRQVARRGRRPRAG